MKGSTSGLHGQVTNAMIAQLLGCCREQGTSHWVVTLWQRASVGPWRGSLNGLPTETYTFSNVESRKSNF